MPVLPRTQKILVEIFGNLLAAQLYWGFNMKLLTAVLFFLCTSHAWALAESYEVMADKKRVSYKMLGSASAPWRLCALLPHGRDRYWWGVSWGLADQARKLGINIGVYKADSYMDLAQQRRQWNDCIAAGAQAIVIAAISSTGLRKEMLSAISNGIPVIDLINGMDFEVTSSSAVDFSSMAAKTVERMLKDAEGRAVKVSWFPGPSDAAWVDAAERGLAAAIAGKPVKILFGGRGATDARTQSTLVRNHLEKFKDSEYLLGNAVAIDFAARYFDAYKVETRPKLYSFYITSELIGKIEAGQVVAAASDQPVVQARIAVDLAVRALQGEPVPKKVSPLVILLDKSNLKALDIENMSPPPKGQSIVQQPLTDARPPAVDSRK